MRHLYRRTRIEPPTTCVHTFPAWAPDRVLDHVLTAGFDIQNYRALPAAGSDHIAVAVELHPRTNCPSKRALTPHAPRLPQVHLAAAVGELGVMARVSRAKPAMDGRRPVRAGRPDRGKARYRRRRPGLQ